MTDQADLLRQLVRNTTADEPSLSTARLTVVCGGKGGVGTTTIAVHLSAALSGLGRRCVLVDADLGRADATEMCGLAPTAGLADLLNGRAGARGLLLAHPAGMEVLPAAWAPSEACAPSPAAVRRLGAELARLSAEGSWVVVDAGNHRGDFLRYLWQQASRVLLVTTPDDVAVMDTYASIKLLHESAPATRLGVVVNHAVSTAAAAKVQGRLEQACRRFLARAVEPCGQIPETPELAGSASGRIASFPLRNPATAHALTRLARLVCQDLVGQEVRPRRMPAPLSTPTTSAGIRGMSKGAPAAPEEPDEPAMASIANNGE